MTETLLSGSASTAGQSMQRTSVHWLSTCRRVWFTSFATHICVYFGELYNRSSVSRWRSD